MQSEVLKRYGQSRIDRINRTPAPLKPEKNYYQLLEPIVLPFVKNWQTDFTEHDAKALEGFTGTFLYAIRDTGTDIFLINPYFSALDEVLQTGKCALSGYFTPRGVNCIIEGTLHLKEAYGVLAITHADRNSRWFIGKGGKIREVTREQMRLTVENYNNQSKPIIEAIRHKWQHQQPFPVVSNDWTFKKPEQPAWVFSQNSDH